jgi:hypothetical protein
MITCDSTPENQTPKEPRRRTLQAIAVIPVRSSALNDGSLPFPTHHAHFSSPRLQTPIAVHQPNWKVPATYFPLFRAEPTKPPRKTALCLGQVESTSIAKKSRARKMQSPKNQGPIHPLARGLWKVLTPTSTNRVCLANVPNPPKAVTPVPCSLSSISHYVH